MEKFLKLLTKVPNDKLLHSFYGTLIFLMLSLFIGDLYSLAVVAVIAGLKEVYDYLNKDKHTPDVWDFVATIFFSSLITLEYYYIIILGDKCQIGLYL